MTAQPRTDAVVPIVRHELHRLLQQFDEGRSHQIGYPVTTDFDYSELAPFFEHMLNNVGDPEVDPTFRQHTKHLEREVVEFFADLFRAPPDDRWGYVTTGGTESNLYALYLARHLFPDGLVYCSNAAHYSIFKAIDLLAMPAITIRTSDSGEIDYTDLGRALDHNRDRAAIVVANIGTTMSEATDDTQRIKTLLHEHAIRRHFIHSDAALAGVPLAMLDQRPHFDLADGADSIAISGHKFIGAPFPCGVLITRRSAKETLSRRISYTGSPDSTISGSRSGHVPLLLWYAIHRIGPAGWRQRAEQSRQLAEYTLNQLHHLGWPAWRNPHAFTIILKTPSPHLAQRWMLANGGNGYSHIVCMPSITRDHIDQFLTELAATQRLSPSRRHRAQTPPSTPTNRSTA
jgi:histidine decarboxylase